MRLARESCMDAIHSSLPFVCVEHPNVSLEHMQTGKPSFGGSLSEDLATVGVKLNCTDWFVSKNN
jgi:hypothetical protein